MSADESLPNRLARPVDASDHCLGTAQAQITLVEYGSYACSHCRLANERITDVREQFGDRIRYVFRHRPLTGSDIARRAAELMECIDDPDQFWSAHVALMTHSPTLTEDDLALVEAELGLDRLGPDAARERRAQAKARVERDISEARSSGVRFTPTFFINGQRYDGPWDTSSFTDAMLGSLGHRVRTAALSFASWAPSTGFLLLAATLLAIALTNSPFGAAFLAFWEQPLSLRAGNGEFGMSLLHWINDGLLTIFFFVVGLEIKREFTVGSLADRKAATLPIAAAVGGMAIPALLYIAIAPAQATHGWGIPIATDTAFAIALLAVLGNRVPVELRVFLTAAAIVDDLSAILIVTLFYAGDLHAGWLLAALSVCLALAWLNYASIYYYVPYVLLGLVLWVCIYQGGVHATLAGVILAAVMPTRPPPNFRALIAQAEGIVLQEARHGGEQYRRGPSLPMLRALDSIHDRVESPADRMLRTVAPRSSYLVLPVFALANAGVVLSIDELTGQGALMLAITVGLVVGKPIGYTLLAWLAVRAGFARKPDVYTWRQLAGAGALAGIGFTMSLFFASQSFPDPTDFAAAKIAVFSASILAAVLGTAMLWKPATPTNE
ncbi:MAG TPA: Na+/H+ antiporter NhaA [Pseudomonadales bacterium]